MSQFRVDIDRIAALVAHSQNMRDEQVLLRIKLEISGSLIGIYLAQRRRTPTIHHHKFHSYCLEVYEYLGAQMSLPREERYRVETAPNADEMIRFLKEIS